ncbi:cell wall protein [Drechmeria coniospora]|uniref:Cell wall protein n=1 Tax=Drechmeria coniospora TaxID=98403 RepID=A0A151GND0_DRECN|nr:cell wall protein [Drechmeria coniospora]KYK58578.1 cell wall protein [Drechmeria coniospora]ODA83940.1 hypothetical protein RJ55_02457 [Drechmeria coniospora]
MKASLIIALAASLVAGQLDSIPTCAQGCVGKYITGGGVAGCKTADIACVCRNKDFLDGIACCLADVCSQEDQDKSVKFARQLCTSSGVQVPDKVVCNKAASSATTTTSTSATASATNAAQSSTSKAAAAPVVGNIGGLTGAVLAMLAAL